MMTASALNKLRGPDPNRWPNIAAAASSSCEKLDLLTGIARDLFSTDESGLVIFGSLARGEFTVDSDLDWAILIDGQADSSHLKIVHELKRRLEEAEFKVPGPTGVFGGLVFSHELVHAIGGDDDTNKNMTRRLLLLLESAAIGASESKAVRARVISGILNRYVEEDANFISSTKGTDKIPRFLLNDVVRFWRTMAVDYVNKYRARAGDGWALRNIKLRMSRKLLFVSGFLMCLSWALKQHRAQPNEKLELIDHLQGWTQRHPLESLATIVDQYATGLKDDIFDAYDEFLLLLNTGDKREALKLMTPDEAYKDPVFLAARSEANKFDAALTKLLFESNDAITQLTKKYGVF